MAVARPADAGGGADRPSRHLGMAGARGKRPLARL